MEGHSDIRHTSVRYSILVAVWAALLVLTWLTVRVAEMHSGSISVASPFIIATLKASLVLAFFMHLKYEVWFFRLMIGISLAVMAVTAWLVYSDVAFRG